MNDMWFHTHKPNFKYWIVPVIVLIGLLLGLAYCTGDISSEQKTIKDCPEEFTTQDICVLFNVDENDVHVTDDNRRLDYYNRPSRINSTIT